MLLCYRRVREDDPDLHGLALYERVLASRGLRLNAIAQVLARAQESFCTWPISRELRFRDVVHYVVVSDYLRAHPKKLGMQSNLTITIGRIIAKEL